MQFAAPPIYIYVRCGNSDVLTYTTKRHWPCHPPSCITFQRDNKTMFSVTGRVFFYRILFTNLYFSRIWIISSSIYFISIFFLSFKLELGFIGTRSFTVPKSNYFFCSSFSVLMPWLESNVLMLEWWRQFVACLLLWLEIYYRLKWEILAKGWSLKVYL